MPISICREDLHFAYTWTAPSQGYPLMIGNKSFDREQGNDVLDFINLFIMLYVPEADKDTALQIEKIIPNIPHYITRFTEAIYWLAKHYGNIITRISYGLHPFGV